MKAVRLVPIWLVGVGCFVLGLVNRYCYYNDTGETRVEGWQYYQAAVADWLLLGMAFFWMQLAVWCFLHASRAEFRPISFMAGLVLSGVFTLYMCLCCALEYLFH